MAADLRERTREMMRGEIAQQMYGLFAARGFDRVTVDDAAAHAGISRATFFRYFASKEEAVILAVQLRGVDFAAVMRGLEPRAGESAIGLLRRVFEPSVVSAEEDPEGMRARVSMIMSTPSIRARLIEKRQIQSEALTVQLADRTGDPLTARVAVVTALALFDLAWREWLARPGSTFRSALDQTMARLADVVAPEA